MEGGAKHQVVDREVVYDFDKERYNQMIIAGFKISNTSKLKRFLCLLYVTSLWLFIFYEMCMGFYSIVLTMDHKPKMLEIFHLTLHTIYVLVLICNKLLSDFDGVLEIINNGFYTYDEKPDDRHYEIRRNHVKKIRITNKWFRTIIISSGISFLFFNTVNKYIESLYKKKPSDIPINPYFPIPFYVPFDTNSAGAFMVVYLSNVVVMFSVCMVTLGLEEVYISLIEQLNAQFKILNLSICNIEERALQRYLNGKIGPKPKVESLYKLKEFQDCVLQCLKENIRHHHVLLRFTALIRNYLERTLLHFLLASCLTLASAVLVITKSKLSSDELLEVGTFMVMLFTEIMFEFQFCFYGEKLMNESARLYFALWSTPWWCFDKRVKSVIIIMMINSKNPVILKSTFLNINASLESFTGDLLFCVLIATIAATIARVYHRIITSAYQVGNVMVNI